MKKIKRECRVCEKEIEIVRTATCTIKGNSGDGKKTSESDSQDGIFFRQSSTSKTGVWFCNSCWKEITKKVKWK